MNWLPLASFFMLGSWTVQAQEALDALGTLELDDSLGGELMSLEATVIEAQGQETLLEMSLLSSSTLSERALLSQVQATLGETLAWQPGLNSASYGQGSSRPVVRGFDGFRVRVLQDSVGTLDVSASSPDHGLPLDPILIDEVEILRGPAALIYGNSALGGVVQVRTRAFKHELPARPVSGAVDLRFDSVAEAWSEGAYLQWHHGDWVMNLRQSYRHANDYQIAGAARTQAYEALFDPIVNDPGQGVTVPIENPEGRLPNSDLESSSASVGLSWLPEEGPWSASMAWSRYRSDYGLPYLFGGDANDLFGDSRIELSQDRVDFRVNYLADQGWLSEARFHFGFGDYFHEESFRGRQGGKDQGLAFADTRFDQQAWEGRLDVFHQLSENLKGLVGLQFWGEDMAPSFLAAAPVESSRFFNDFETRNIGFFLNESYQVGDFELSGALRYEQQEIHDLSLADFGFSRRLENESTSLSLGGRWVREGLGALERVEISLNGSRVERLPTATERYAFWSNPAIQRFLIGGDLDGTPLETELSRGLDLGVELEWHRYSLGLNTYAYWIDDFVFLQDVRGIGNQARYVATDALYVGFELEAEWRLIERDDETLTWQWMADWVRAEDRLESSPMPRIPPLRFGMRWAYESGGFDAALELRHALAQNRVQLAGEVAQGELPTDAYTEVNLELGREFDWGDGQSIRVFVQGRNLLDQDRRLHTSFVKDVAPLPGRSWVLGARWNF